MKNVKRAAALFVFVCALAACASSTRNDMTKVAPAPDAMVMGNACSAQANQGCNSCQVSCPIDMIAYCAPGTGTQVLTTGGIYTWQCWTQPQCSCTKPKSDAK